MSQKRVNKIILHLVLVVAPALIQAQQIHLEGRLLDGTTLEPLAFASVLVDNSTIGTFTKEDGTFTINIDKLPVTLVFSYVGYKRETFLVSKDDQLINVYLHSMSYLFQEVSIYSKGDLSTALKGTELKSEQVKKFAGMTKDALRTIQLMPGVSVNNETSAKLNVRGGTYDENLVLINGVEVYNPFHIKEAAIASVGIFNIDMIKSIDFSAGGFSAEYGNALSSILRIDYASGDKKNYSGKVDLSLMDLSLLYSGPINSNSTFNIGFRKSYLDYLIRWTNLRTDLYVGYYDLQGQLNYDFTPQHKLKFNFIYSGDNAELDQSPEFSIINNYLKVAGKQSLVTTNRVRKRPFNGDYGNGLVSLISENVFNSDLMSKTTVSFYSETENEESNHRDTSHYSYKDYPNYWSIYTHTADLVDYLKINTFSVKQDILYQISPSTLMKAGVSVQNIFFEYRRDRNGTDRMITNVDKYPNIISKLYPPDAQYNDSSYLNTAAYKLAGYIQQTHQSSERLILEYGLRADYFDINKQLVFSPRFTLAYKFLYGFTLRAALGIFFQPPTFKQLRSSSKTENNTRFQEAVHYIFGIDKELTDNIYSRLEFYYKDYYDLIPATKSGEGALSYGKKFNSAIGYAKGFDFQLNANLNWIYLWISYGYLVSEEKIDVPSERYYPRYTDQRHTLSTVINFDLGSGWQFDVRGFYGSGYAYTPSQSVWDQTQQIYKWIAGTKNSRHYLPYERIDLRLSKVFTIHENELSVYADIMNVLNRENVLYLRYTYDEQGRPKIENKTLFGIIPTMGISYTF